MRRRASPPSARSGPRPALSLLLCAAALAAAVAPCASRAAQVSDAEARPAPDADALRTITASLDALGGAARLKAVRSISFSAAGREHRSAEAQWYHPERETDAAHQETFVAFPSQNRLAYEHKTGRYDGTVRWRRWVFDGDERTVADFTTRFAGARRHASTGTERARRARRVPHLLLLEAEANAAALRSLGRAAHAGRAHDVIAFRPPGERAELRLFFDAETRLLSKQEYATNFPGLGDVTVELSYDAYRRHERLGQFPAGDVERVADKVFRRVAYANVEVDSPRADSLFKLPDDLAPFVAAPGTVSEVAEGVYVVNSLGGYYPLFVEFKDFVLAAEAPAAHPALENFPADDGAESSSALSELYVSKIKEAVPGKPIRYVVPTHSHSDHAGGARAFMAEGATVLAAPHDRAFFERLAAATFALAPDKFAAAASRQARVETFERKRVVTDGERVVELINVGPNPHGESGIVVYLPRERILFEGDLFYFDGEATFPARERLGVMKFFAGWLAKNGIAAERIYTFHGRGFATMQHVRRALAEGAPRG